MSKKISKAIGTIQNTIKKHKKIVAVVLLVALVAGYFGITSFMSKSKTSQFQTANAERGTLITSVSASGKITSVGKISMSTLATGVVKEVYVKNGDAVTQGQKIAEITIDQNTQQKQAEAWSNYLSALSSEKASEVSKQTADSAMWTAQQSRLNAQNDVDYKNGNSVNPSTKRDYTDLEKQSIDSSLIQAQKAFDAAEQKYNDADLSINSAKAQITSSWYSYQQLSSTITAPIAGVVSGLTISPGAVLASSSSSSSNSSSSSSTDSSQKIGTIDLQSGSLQGTVNLTEIDVTKVKEGQKATLTLDAFPNKTFTGKVLAIDTNGSVTSGVTTYQTIISFDTGVETIYPNMAVLAKIITSVKDDALLVPSAAVTTSNDQSTVQVLKNGKTQTVAVEVGASNDTQTDIVSGLNEGDTVVTGTTAPSSSTRTSTGVSPFGNTGFGGGGFGGGGRRN